jgi:hypothetical protein
MEGLLLVQPVVMVEKVNQIPLATMKDLSFKVESLLLVGIVMMVLVLTR